MSGSISYLIGELRSRGVEFRYEDGCVTVIGPERLIAGVLPELRRRREELIQAIRPNRCEDCGVTCGTGVRCSSCAAARVVRNAASQRKSRLR